MAQEYIATDRARDAIYGVGRTAAAAIDDATQGEYGKYVAIACSPELYEEVELIRRKRTELEGDRRKR